MLQNAYGSVLQCVAAREKEALMCSAAAFEKVSCSELQRVAVQASTDVLSHGCLIQ